MSNGEINGGEMIIVFFSILSGGFQIGAFITNWQYITTAQGAARFVYDVCEKVGLSMCISLDHNSYPIFDLVLTFNPLIKEKKKSVRPIILSDANDFMVLFE